MEMLTDDQVTDATLADWRKLGQGLHARYVVSDFSNGARFVVDVAEAGDAIGHHPRVTLGDGYADLKLVSDDAVCRDHHDRDRPRHRAAASIAPVWAALLTGGTGARNRGTIGDDVRDATGRVPILWFQDTDEHETPRQRIAAAFAAGGVVVDDSQTPDYTVIADQDGTKACVCTTA